MLVLGRIARGLITEGLPAEQVVIATTTVAESYAVTALDRLVHASDVVHSAFGRALLTANRGSLTRSWRDRLSWLSKGFGVGLDGGRPAQDFLTLVELRNAIVHGGGRLGERRVRDMGKLAVLERRLRAVLDVEVEGRQLVLGERSGSRAVVVTKDFLSQADDAICRAHPTLKL